MYINVKWNKTCHCVRLAAWKTIVFPCVLLILWKDFITQFQISCFSIKETVVFFFPHGNICYGTHNKRLMSTHKICFHWETRKILCGYSLLSEAMDLIFLLSYKSHANLLFYSLRKHAYSKILKILPPKNENFQIKNSDNFHISDQNIDCGYSLEPPRRGGSNEYPQSMFLSRNKKIYVYPCKPQFYFIKVGY